VAAGGLNAASSAGPVPPAVPAPPVRVAPIAPVPPVATAPLPSRGAPVPASAAPLPVTVLTVIGVHLGLAWGTPVSRTGEAWLVPVYVFELSGGGTVPVLAVADGLVATPPAVPTGGGPLPAPATAQPAGAPTVPNG
jgi:hypothetical protein